MDDVYYTVGFTVFWFWLGLIVIAALIVVGAALEPDDVPDETLLDEGN